MGGSRKASDMTKRTNKPATKKSAPKKVAAGYPEMSVDDAALFEQGRFARKNGVGKDDSPLSGKARVTWVKGWKFQDKART